MEEYRRWEDNIKTDLRDIGVDVMNWIDSNSCCAVVSLRHLPARISSRNVERVKMIHGLSCGGT